MSDNTIEVDKQDLGEDTGLCVEQLSRDVKTYLEDCQMVNRDLIGDKEHCLIGELRECIRMYCKKESCHENLR